MINTVQISISEYDELREYKKGYKLIYRGQYGYYEAREENGVIKQLTDEIRILKDENIKLRSRNIIKRIFNHE